MSEVQFTQLQQMHASYIVRRNISPQKDSEHEKWWDQR